MEMVSLYEFLGRAAGLELGKRVNDIAILNKQKTGKRQVDNLKYKGEVFTYDRKFLELVFRDRSKD